MTEPGKIVVSKVLKEVAALAYNEIRTSILKETGDIFLDWATKYGATFKDDKEKGAAIDELASSLPEAPRGKSIMLNGSSQSETLNRIQSNKNRKKSSAGEDERVDIRYKKGQEKHKCQHILGATAKNPYSQCRFNAKFWHHDHDTEEAICADEDNSCKHSRCARHVSSKSENTKKAEARQKSRKSGKKLSVEIGTGDGSKKLDGIETKGLLREKHPDQENINDIIAEMRKRNKKKKEEKEEKEEEKN